MACHEAPVEIDFKQFEKICFIHIYTSPLEAL